MATSDTAQISTIIDLIQILNPKSILDVGCGWGKYGFLSREYLVGMYWSKDTVLIDAVEAYEKNITALQREIYNNLYLCNALDFESYLKRKYDLILLIDVFEHFSKEDGDRVIRMLREKSRNLLISIPRYVTVQKGYSDDTGKFEEHRAFWTRKMFKKFGKCFIIPNNARKTIALYTDGTGFNKKIKSFVRGKLVSKFLPYFINDVYNYFRWMVNKNNRELFLEKEK